MKTHIEAFDGEISYHGRGAFLRIRAQSWMLFWRGQRGDTICKKSGVGLNPSFLNWETRFKDGVFISSLDHILDETAITIVCLYSNDSKKWEEWTLIAERLMGSVVIIVGVAF